MKKVYIIGIGGAGTSALAIIYKKRGYDVTGSDDGDGFYVHELTNSSITVFDTFDKKHLAYDVDFVVYTTAMSKDNIEMQQAKKMSLKIMSYPEAVGQLTKKSKTIAVCGTHGKTTTTALMTHAFISAGYNPTAIVGSKITAWGSGAYVGNEEYFILEADEYQNKLAFYNSYAVILTNVDFDHPDFFDDFDTYKKVFSDFVRRIPEDGFLVACGDDDDVREVALCTKSQVLFYGERELNNCRITKRETHQDGQEITIILRDTQYQISIQLFGLHNAKNAVAAWLMSGLVAGDMDSGTKGVSACVGTARRFEKKGMLNDAILIDDYAHHPEEIKATLTTVQEVFNDKKIIAAFHPHTFSRTEALLDEFAHVLSTVDEVIVLDIFSSAREVSGNITAQDLVDKINCDKKQNIHTIVELADWMQKNLKDGDVFVTMGAGDIYKVYNQI